MSASSPGGDLSRLGPDGSRRRSSVLLPSPRGEGVLGARPKASNEDGIGGPPSPPPRLRLRRSHPALRAGKDAAPVQVSTLSRNPTPEGEVARRVERPVLDVAHKPRQITMRGRSRSAKSDLNPRKSFLALLACAPCSKPSLSSASLSLSSWPEDDRTGRSKPPPSGCQIPPTFHARGVDRPPVRTTPTAGRAASPSVSQSSGLPGPAQTRATGRARVPSGWRCRHRACRCRSQRPPGTTATR